MQVNGHCHCGAITFTAELDPEKVLICHCTDCQTLSGSAYRIVAPAEDGSFKLLSGEMKTYVKIAEDGTPRALTFCPNCGTPIYAGPVEGGSGMLGIRVGTLEQRAQLHPRKQYYCGSAQTWVQELSEVVRVEG